MIAEKRPGLAIKPGLNGFLGPCRLIDFELQPYMKRIARAYFSPAREVAVILPRGNAKTTMAALIALHHLLTVKGASIVVGASSRDQARVAFERMESFLEHRALAGMVTRRHLELRFDGPDGRRLLRVVPSDGPRTHGLSCTLYVGDEVWAWAQRADLLTAFTTGLVKRRDSKLLLISTSAGDLDSPLGRLRRRAMAMASAHRAGPVVEAKSRDFHWLEWSLGDQHELDNLKAIKRCNPAPWIGVGDLRRQQKSLAPAAFGCFTRTGGAFGNRSGCPRAPGPAARARSTSPPARGSTSASTSARPGPRPRSAGSIHGCTSAARSSRASRDSTRRARPYCAWPASISWRRDASRPEPRDAAPTGLSTSRRRWRSRSSSAAPKESRVGSTPTASC